MWRDLGRRLAMIVLLVAVATGFAVPAYFAGPHHNQAAIGLTMDIAHPSGCVHDGCPVDQNTAMQDTCFAACAGVTVLPPIPTAVYRAIAHDVLAPSLDLAMIDRSIPPDPYPPKHA